LFVLTLDLPPPRLVLGKLFLTVVGLGVLPVEDAERLRLGPARLLPLARARHARRHLLSGFAACTRSSCRTPRRNRADRSRCTGRRGTPLHSWDRGASAPRRHLFPRFWLSSPPCGCGAEQSPGQGSTPGRAGPPYTGGDPPCQVITRTLRRFRARASVRGFVACAFICALSTARSSSRGGDGSRSFSPSSGCCPGQQW